MSSFLGERRTRSVHNVLRSGTLPFAANDRVISTLVLKLRRTFSERGVLLLFSTTDRPGRRIGIETLVSVLVALCACEGQARLCPRVTSELTTLTRAPKFVGAVHAVVLHFVLTHRARGVAHGLRSRVVPRVLGLDPGLDGGVGLGRLAPRSLAKGRVGPR